MKDCELNELREISRFKTVTIKVFGYTARKISDMKDPNLIKIILDSVEGRPVVKLLFVDKEGF